MAVAVAKYGYKEKAGYRQIGVYGLENGGKRV